MRYTRSLGTYWERVTPKLIIEGNNIFNRSNVTTILTNATVFYVLSGVPYLCYPGAECQCDWADYTKRLS